MEAVLTSAVAVVGILLGGCFSYLVQHRMTIRNERFARWRFVQEERMAAYSAYAAALAHCRRGELDRWHRAHENPGSAEATEARVESYRLRSVARQELFRLRLVAQSPGLVRLAEEALDRVSVIHKAEDEQECHRSGDAAREAVEAFVQAAGQQIVS
ncbi:hypothetical protein [Streptomyces dysideae]|uniref:Uncharacterized protein n=1 Tax=Streptomyces dysideae TaxID=909626 RepID=A0A101USV5_9ACTN|nr:hypothetical protein [Streptomyces dysideae]KUO16243.1 hypothetical protein AQJ91_37120 [Streptomyces dysideae]